MQLAYVTMSGRGAVDEFIADVVRVFECDGLRLAGTVREKPADLLGHPWDMDLRVLPDGPAFRISQPLGSGAKGCRLDSGVIETIATAVEAGLPQADILIVNKFGKLESQGRGFGPAISMALDMGLPTLVGVNEMNTPDFLAFSGGLGEALLPDCSTVRAWYGSAPKPRVPAAVWKTLAAR